MKIGPQILFFVVAHVLSSERHLKLSQRTDLSMDGSRSSSRFASKTAEMALNISTSVIRPSEMISLSLVSLARELFDVLEQFDRVYAGYVPTRIACYRLASPAIPILARLSTCDFSTAQLGIVRKTPLQKLSTVFSVYHLRPDSVANSLELVFLELGSGASVVL